LSQFSARGAAQPQPMPAPMINPYSNACLAYFTNIVVLLVSARQFCGKIF
jgi:hypothetical protein